MDEKNRKVEASMPVQSRVDLRILAELLIYWDKQGMFVSSMSKLISWSLDMFRGVLVENNALPKRVKTLEEAVNLLSARGVIQRNVMKRAEKKLFVARGLENIRLNGGFVGKETKGFKQLHNRHSVEPLESLDDQEYSPEEEKRVKEKLMKVYREIEKRDMKKNLEKQKEEAIKAARSMGKLVNVDNVNSANNEIVNNVNDEGDEKEIKAMKRLKEIEEEDKKLAEMDLSKPLLSEEELEKKVIK